MGFPRQHWPLRQPLTTPYRVTDRRCRCRYIRAITSVSRSPPTTATFPKWCLSGLWCTKGNFAITMALAELAEQLQIDELEIIERNRVHEGQELKILGAIGEGKAPTSFPSAASCALEEILRQGREDDPMVFAETANGDWHIGRGVAIIMQKSGIPDIDSG
ncbi:hypothetical protein ACVXHB_10190 [Escherichia coli]